jgi:hypothetical protein
LGLDGKDGHIRVTRAKVFELYGGSEETHAKMQESCIRFSEKLDKRGKRLEDLPSGELHDLAAQCELTPLLEFRRDKKTKAND